MKQTKTKAGNPAEAISKLQRGVLRLALSFHGQHPELDKRLKKLGTLIRGGRKDEELQNLIDEIVDTIVSQGVSQNSEQRGGKSLTNLLERIEAKMPRPTALRSIQQQLSTPLDSDSFDRLLDSAARIICDLVTEQSSTTDTLSNTQPESPNLQYIDHLLNELVIPDDISTQITEVQRKIATRKNQVDIVMQVDRLAEIISNAVTEQSGSGDIDQAREQLLLLMNLIPFGADMSDRSSRTRRSIENSTTAAELYACIPEIADLTAAMRVQLQAEVTELGEFLKTTMTRLQGFENQISQSRDSHEESRKCVFNLERTVGNQVDGMRSDIEDETDIDAIKASVNNHLENIGEGLNEFVRREDQRHQQAREKLNNMVSAISELETEAEDLRSSLEKQHEQVLIDPLTGILNRSGYDENINKEFTRWRRYNSSLSLAVIDLDLFKHINDTYGHAAGDKVLTTVAQQIESQIRDSDILCRYGGEEFVLLLPETDLEHGLSMLDKLRTYIAECNFHFQKTPVPVTLSCGIAEFHRGDDVADVFDRADQAMYLAKRAGRNKTCSETELETASA